MTVIEREDPYKVLRESVQLNAFTDASVKEVVAQGIILGPYPEPDQKQVTSPLRVVSDRGTVVWLQEKTVWKIFGRQIESETQVLRDSGTRQIHGGRRFFEGS